MDQICLVVPILPGRTADARGCMPEPETGGQRSEQRTGLVKEAWYLGPTPAETSWRLEQSARVRLLASHGRGRAHAPRPRD